KKCDEEKEPLSAAASEERQKKTLPGKGSGLVGEAIEEETEVGVAETSKSLQTAKTVTGGSVSDTRIRNAPASDKGANIKKPTKRATPRATPRAKPEEFFKD